MGEIQAVADEQTRCLMGVALQSCLRVDLVLVFTGDLMMGKKGGNAPLFTSRASARAQDMNCGIA